MLLIKKTFALILTLLLCGANGLYSQQISGMEYFIDSDPGYGNGIAIPTGGPTDTITISSSITLPGGLADGFHALSIRTLSDSGAWSIPESRTFMVQTIITNNPVSAMEYFFDTDPGVGNGIPISIGNSTDTVRLTLGVPLSSLDEGFHRMHVRAMNEGGTWSIRESRAFYVVEISLDNIAGYEYFWDSLISPGEGEYIEIDPAVDSFHMLEIIPIDEEMTLGAHDLYLRARTTNNIWSIHEKREVTICSEYGVIAGFELFIDDHTVYFTDSTQYVETITWDFGDGHVETGVFNPIRTYEAGYYEICQTVSNPCATQTVCHQVAIKGLIRITPDYSANNSLVITHLHGVGFTPGSEVWLQSNDGHRIDMDTVIYIDSTLLKANVLFRDDPIGNYTVYVNAPGSFLDSIVDGFELQSPIPFTGEISIVNRGRILRGTPFGFSVIIKNLGNQPGVVIPLSVEFDAAKELTVDYETVLVDTVPQVVRDSIPKLILVVNPLTQDSFYHTTVLIPYIGPGETKMWTFYVTTAELGNYHMEAYLSDSWYTDEQLMAAGIYYRGSCDFLGPCIECAVDLAALIPFPVVGCVGGLINTLCAAVNLATETAEEGIDGEDFTLNVVDWAWNLAGTIVSCVPGVEIFKVYSLLINIVNTLKAMEQECAECLSDIYDFANDLGDFTSVASLDPNVKYGPSGATDDHYINGTNSLNYYISFENIDTATAPAREVTVVDVLDANMLDINSLQLTSYGFGDNTYALDNNTKQFIRHYPLSPGISVLRVQGKIESGILEWKFSTYDADSLQLINDVSEGFLPPNINRPEGEGFVTFNIKLKPGYSHLDLIENDAEIYFDANEPIITPAWKNTIDLELPYSAVDDLPSVSNDTLIELTWQGGDDHAGILDYTIYVSEDGGEFLPYARTKKDRVVFIGEYGSSYKFYSIARDRVYNREDDPSDPHQDPDASTSLEQATTPVKEYHNLSSLAIKPNPANDQAAISFDLKESSKVNIHSYNGNGTYRKLILDELLGVGHYSFLVNTNNWENGMYYLVVEVDGKIFGRKLLVLKD